LAVGALQECDSCDTETQARKNIVLAIDQVRERLGNTRAVCRKYYIHPAVLDAYLEGKLPPPCPDIELGGACSGLSPDETAVLAFLKQRAGPTGVPAPPRRPLPHAIGNRPPPIERLRA
jgi:DNA topoisomerase-1